jgi:S1-C subfamily serine protease
VITNPKPAIIQKLFPAIAMVEDVSLPSPDRIVGDNIVGTAFVADTRGYLLTAKHVVEGLGAKDLKLRTTYSAFAVGQYALSITPVTAIYPHPSLDITVLAVGKALPPARLGLPFNTGVAAVGSDILLVGYATGTDLVFCDEILGKGSAKSYSPVAFGGMICARVPDDDRPLDLLVYDCSTFGGNSGAPVVSIDTGDIIGLHVRGYEHHVGYGIPIDRCIPFMNSATRAEIRPAARAVEYGGLNDYQSASLEALHTVCKRMEAKL